MYRIKLTPTANQMFNKLHPTIKKQLKPELKKLCSNPYLGKGLHDELFQLRAIKIKRYRAIYQINCENKEVIILAIGHRRNIYEIITSNINTRGG